MKNKKLGVLSIGFMALIGLSNEALAYPMFGKQMGTDDCKACHMQHMPKLNSTGRSFAASGMTQSIKKFDENGSKMDLNPSLMVKSMYEETWDKPTSDGTIKNYKTPTAGGDWSVPKTASLLLGGRVSENVGAIIDLSYKDIEDNGIGGKVVYAKEVADGYLGAALYSSASFGPFSGMETYNSGLYKPLRTFDIRKLSNAFQAAEIGTGAATGVQVYYDSDKIFTGSDHLFVSIGAFTPAQDNVNMQMNDNILAIGRIAYEYGLGDFNLIFGGFGIGGGERVASTQPLSILQETYGLDFQLEGAVADKSVSLILSKVLKNRVTYTGISANLLEPERNTNLDSKAFSAEGEINILENLGLKAAYLTFDDLSGYTETGQGPGYAANHVNVRDIDHAYTVGVDYSFKLYLPMKLAVEHSWATPALDRIKNYRDFLVSLNILY